MYTNSLYFRADDENKGMPYVCFDMTVKRGRTLAIKPTSYQRSVHLGYFGGDQNGDEACYEGLNFL